LAGAAFIVSPFLVKDVARYCVKNKIPVFPGALTPQEIYHAWEAGATMVKVFPAKFFGPEYLKEIKGPFNDIQLLACSGVTPENLKEYFACGASAASFGASVFRREWLEQAAYNNIGKEIDRFVEAFRKL
jgi:2-dehydro-3-deoxyphosphogluconate aldolase/(4S)-4-hydroxy-2-oxoglutarate aldolase